jgi:hypothetical protein
MHWYDTEECCVAAGLCGFLAIVVVVVVFVNLIGCVVVVSSWGG